MRNPPATTVPPAPMIIRTTVKISDNSVEQFRQYFEKIVNSKFAFEQAIRNGHITFETKEEEGGIPRASVKARESGEAGIQPGTLSNSITVDKVIDLKGVPVETNVETAPFEDDEQHKTEIVDDRKEITP